MATLTFEDCLAFTLKYEGGYVDHPADPGGATNLGITQKTLSAWRGYGVSKAEVRALGKPEAGQIYRKQYWDTVRADALPAGVDLVVFDFAVNSGPARAAKALQRALGVDPDGVVGTVTLDALTGKDPRQLVTAICDERGKFFRSLSTFKTFGKGWMARLSAVRAAGHRMIQRLPEREDAPPVTEPPAKARERDTATTSKSGFWEKLTAGGGVLATVLGAVTDWKVLAVLCGAAVLGLIVWRIFDTEVAA